MNVCPICGCNIEKPEGNREGDLFECTECGVLLEITSLEPFEFILYEEPEK